MKLSREFVEAIRKNPLPIFIVATETGFHPSRLSRLAHGELVKRPHDIRFKLLATKIGFEGPIFDKTYELEEIL